jgi:glycosyltransferase 2 family protein
MAAGERFSQIARRAGKLASTRRVRRFSNLLLAAALIFVALRLRTLWNDSHVDVGTIRWVPLVGAFALLLAAGAVTAVAWLLILMRLGVTPEARWAGIPLQAQLAKYVPGSIWQYAGRVALARDEGIPSRVVVTSIASEFVAALVAAATVGTLTAGWWAAVAAACVAAALALWRRPAQRLARALRHSLLRPRLADVGRSLDGARSVLWAYVGLFFVLGFSFWLTGRSLIGLPTADFPFVTGAFAIAWLAGFVVVLAPGGLGVREVVLVALLRTRMSTADAALLAAASRVLWTLSDLVASGAGFVLLRRRGRG